MSQSGKLMPNLDQQSTKLLNLTVLQRMDPYIEEILITAAHVTFYGFNIDLNQWSRKDVEGSLFVVKRNTQPRFQFIVMNRRSTENLVENLLGDFEYELQVPYLLYRNGAQEVNGIWFYNARECEEVANLFTRILSAYSKVPPKIKGSPSKSEFEELESVSTSGVIEGAPEPSFTPSSSSDVPEDSAFLNFFSTATNIGHNPPNVVSSAQQPYHNTSTTVPLSSRLPAALSPAPTLQMPNLPLSVSSNFTMPIHESLEPINTYNRIANLVMPSSFFSPPSSSSSALMPASIPTSALHPPLNLQRAHGHGTPMLQPFPPPTPHISLTPNAASLPNYGTVSREKVRDALLMLVQDNQFIEMFYQALTKGHQS